MGYRSWEPSVRRALEDFRAPFVLTSYNDAEADDDCGSLEDMGFVQAHWSRPGWLPEVNTFAAAFARPSVVNEGRPLCEQHWWQCLMPITPQSAGEVTKGAV